MTLLSNIVQNTTDINDEVISHDMLAGSTGLANAYLNAALTSATPELRAMYSSSLSQVIAGHSGDLELAINRGWENPYISPNQQLSDSYKKSQTMIDQNQ